MQKTLTPVSLGTMLTYIQSKTDGPSPFQNLNPRKMQINLTGFLNGKNARVFMHELWELLCSASTNPNGIPDSFIEEKKEEIKKRNVSAFRKRRFLAFENVLI